MSAARKRILLVGAGGVIGKHLVAALTPNYEIVRAGHSGPDLALDLNDAGALVAKLKSAGPLDAVISTAGRANFVPLSAVPPAGIEASPYGLGLKDKLLGQVNLALAAREVLSEGGSIILTTGTTNETPVLGGSSLSMVNGAIEAWVRAAATELRGIRINAVSPSLIEGTSGPALAAFPGFEVVSGQKMAYAYIRCLESGINGVTLRI